MITPTDIRSQVDAAQSDDLKVLIVGAGIAGLTIAALLRRRGTRPVLIERAPDGGHPGYMLALMPMADAAIGELGLVQRYRASSVPLQRFAFHAHTGKTAREDALGNLFATYGDYRGIGRGELMDVLTTDECPATLGATVTAIDDTATGSKVTIETSDGPVEHEFDLVIVADGLNSRTRELIPGAKTAAELDTGWGGWVVWAPDDGEHDRADELWGARFFLGTYPVKDRIGVFLGGPRRETQNGPLAFAAQCRASLKTVEPRIALAFETVGRTDEPYYWSLRDTRAPRWATDRTVLLGDAAAGFLPTAGIGAGMAMESAWVLARALEAATPETLPAALRFYESAQRQRVEAAQDASRQLGRLMFGRGKAFASARDVAVRLMSARTLLRPIEKLLASRPTPDRPIPNVARE